MIELLPKLYSMNILESFNNIKFKITNKDVKDKEDFDNILASRWNLFSSLLAAAVCHSDNEITKKASELSLKNLIEAYSSAMTGKTSDYRWNVRAVEDLEAIKDSLQKVLEGSNTPNFEGRKRF